MQQNKNGKNKNVGNKNGKNGKNGFAFWFSVCAWILFIVACTLYYFRDNFENKFISKLGFAVLPSGKKVELDITSNNGKENGKETAQFDNVKELPNSAKETLNRVKETQNSAKIALNKVAPMVTIPGGVYMMGNDLAGSADQRPAHEVKIAQFEIDKFEVTNQQFRLFVEATGYKTTAESNGWSYVFDSKKQGWTKMPGANWETDRLILPTNSTGDDWLNLPVVHISYIDALAFCDWAEKRLPTEAEWEYVARSGRIDSDYPWGNQREPNGRFMANYWQGWFPTENTDSDGFHFLAPVGSFQCSDYGVYDIAGNVAEWCSDIYDENYYRRSPRENPIGPLPSDSELLSDDKSGFSVNSGVNFGVNSGADSGTDSLRFRAVRGGSFLSAENSDQAYKVYVRSKQLENLSYQNIGFRCARNLDENK